MPSVRRMTPSPPLSFLAFCLALPCMDCFCLFIWLRFGLWAYLMSCVLVRPAGGEKDTGGGRESGSDSWKQYMRRSTWYVQSRRSYCGACVGVRDHRVFLFVVVCCCVVVPSTVNFSSSLPLAQGITFA